MKRIISCLLIAAATLLSGCSVGKPKLDPNAFYVEVDVKCGGVYILECEYSLDGEPVGGRSVQNAISRRIFRRAIRSITDFFPRIFQAPPTLKAVCSG